MRILPKSVFLKVEEDVRINFPNVFVKRLHAHTLDNFSATISEPWILS